MSGEVIAKKYVKALVSSVDLSELENLSIIFDSLSKAFKNSKFKDIILSPEIDKVKKENFLLSIIDSKNSKVQNLLKLIVQNGRSSDIPEISKVLNHELAIKKNEFDGSLISNQKIEDSDLKDIEQKVSKKLNSTIHLNNIVKDYNGLKVEIDDLGVEIALSTDRLKSQLVDHVLKAIN